MTGNNNNRVYAIFKELYDEVFYLVDWVNQVTNKKSVAGQLLLETDSESFGSFLESTVIGVIGSVKPRSGAISFSQASHQQEIIFRVIERLFKRNGAAVKNVLTLGFGPKSNDPDAHLSSVASIESYYPNNNVSRLQSCYWKKLLTRVGDDVMAYLLENTAIFMFLPPSCYIQLAGFPIYELWSFKPGKSVKLLDSNIHKQTGIAKRHRRYWQQFSIKESKIKKKKMDTEDERSRDGSQADIFNPVNLHGAESPQHIPKADEPHNTSVSSQSLKNHSRKFLTNDVQMTHPQGIKRKLLIQTDNTGPEVKYLKLDYVEKERKILKLKLFEPEINCLKLNVYELGAKALRLDVVEPKRKCLKLNVVGVERNCMKLNIVEPEKKKMKLNDVEPKGKWLKLNVRQKINVLEVDTCVNYPEVQQNDCKQTRKQLSESSQGKAVPIGQLSESSENKAVPIGQLSESSQNKADSFGQPSESAQYEAIPIGRLEKNSRTIKFVPLLMKSRDNVDLMDNIRNYTNEQPVSQCVSDSTSRYLTNINKSSERNGGMEVHESSKYPANKRRRRKRKAKCKEIKDYKPYDFHKYFARMNLLYTKNLRESLDKSFCLNKFDASQLLEAIFPESAIAIPQCNNNCDKQSDLVKNISTNQNSCLIASQIGNTVNCDRTNVSGVCENGTANHQIDLDLNNMENSQDSSKVACDTRASHIPTVFIDNDGELHSLNSSVSVRTDQRIRYHPMSSPCTNEQRIHSPPKSSFITEQRVCSPPKSSFITEQRVCSPQKSSFITEQRVCSPQKSSFITEQRVCSPLKSSFITEQRVCSPPKSSPSETKQGVCSSVKTFTSDQVLAVCKCPQELSSTNHRGFGNIEPENKTEGPVTSDVFKENSSSQSSKEEYASQVNFSNDNKSDQSSYWLNWPSKSSFSSNSVSENHSLLVKSSSVSDKQASLIVSSVIGVDKSNNSLPHRSSDNQNSCTISSVIGVDKSNSMSHRSCDNQNSSTTSSVIDKSNSMPHRSCDNQISSVIDKSNSMPHRSCDNQISSVIDKSNSMPHRSCDNQISSVIDKSNSMPHRSCDNQISSVIDKSNSMLHRSCDNQNSSVIDKSNSMPHGSSDYDIGEFTSLSSETKKHDSTVMDYHSSGHRRTSRRDLSTSSGSDKSKDLFVDSLSMSSECDTQADAKLVFTGLNQSSLVETASRPNLSVPSSATSKHVFLDSVIASSDFENVDDTLDEKPCKQTEKSFEVDGLQHDKQQVLLNISSDRVRISGENHSSFYGSENSKDILLGAITTIETVAMVTDQECCMQLKKSLVKSLRPTCDCTTTRTNSFHENVQPLLQRMLSNHRKCPYRHLLNHYCPAESINKKEKCSTQSIGTGISVQTAGCTDGTSSSQSKSVPACSFKRSSDLSDPVVIRRQPQNENIKRLTALRILQSQKKLQNKKHKMSTGILLETFCTNFQVFCLFRAILLKVVPSELLGSKSNRNIFFKNLKTFICLGKYDKFCLGQVMTGIKVTSCKWLRSVEGQSAKVEKLAQIVWWLFNDYIMTLLKAFFYITDTTTYRNRLFYYRKKIWHLLHMRAVQDLVQKKMLQAVSESRVTELLKTESSLGISYLRFLPKCRSLRPIINMGRRPACGTRKTLSVNQQLTKLLHVLKFHVKTDRSIIGSSLFGIDDIYQAWSKFVQKRSLKQDGRCLYFVKTDISGCFDSIRQDKLFSIITEILNENTSEEYVTRRFASVVVSGGRLKRTFHRDSHTLLTFQPEFFVFTKKRMSEDNLRNIILVDQVINQHDTVNSLLNTLKAHLFNNIIKVGRRFYLQHTGISQGSVLSTMLCNLYYGHMERQTVDVADDELLLRMIDDFLYVTPHKIRAESFLDHMLRGNQEYNCKTNINKVLTNFTVSDSKRGNIPSIKLSGRIDPSQWTSCSLGYFPFQPVLHNWFIKGCEPLPWCGLLLNTQTLEVSVDYSRYAGLCISDTMTFDLANQPGLAMKNKLTQSLRPKCHGIFFDSKLNSEEMVVINVYKLMVLTAHKFHVYMLQLPPSRRASSNIKFFQGMILTLSTQLYYQSTDKMSRNQEEDNKKVFPLSLDIVKWLTLEAFLSKMKKHHSVYSALIKALEDVKRGLRKKMFMLARGPREDQIVND